jgi:type II secretory pathway pseudopilin PulG
MTRAFTVLEVLIAVLVAAVLLAVLAPSLAAARAAGRRAACLVQVRSIGTESLRLAQTYGGRRHEEGTPGAGMVCPSSPRRAMGYQAWDGTGDPAFVRAMLDGHAVVACDVGPWHEGRAVGVYADGKAEVR